MNRPSPRDLSAAAAPDHWQILGLAPGADSAALKRAFRAQARRWHPDLNGNDPLAEERFKQVNEAYAVLSDPLRRRAWENGEPEGIDADADPFASGFPRFQDYLAELEGREPAAGRASGRRPAHPAARDRGDGHDHDQRHEHAYDEHAYHEHGYHGHGYHGHADDIGHDRHQDQDDRSAERGDSGGSGSGSSGSGGAGGAGRGPRGWVEPRVSPPPPVRASGDQESVVELTPAQALQGERVELALSDGTVVEVITPPLAGDGWRLRLAAVAPGGGDHFLQLRVRTASGLRIDGLRVHYPLEITPAEAVLGCQVVVPTLEGPVKLRVPPGSSSGRLLRLRGRGQRLGERQGDQLVEVKITVEEPHGDDELALYRRLRQLEQQRRQPPEG